MSPSSEKLFQALGRFLESVLNPVAAWMMLGRDERSSLMVIPQKLDFRAADRVGVLISVTAVAGLVAIAPSAGLRRREAGLRPFGLLTIDIRNGERDMVNAFAIAG